MKLIAKNEVEPGSFSEWKALANEAWQPTFEELSGREKRDVLNALLDEQGAICCYCGQKVDDQTCHIEHFQPQSEFEYLQLDYGNLHASCQKKREKRMPQYCGVAKDNWFDAELLISPLDPDCESAFHFSDHGQISPADTGNRAAKMTIQKLKLDEPALDDLRREAIAGFLDNEFLAQATDTDLETLHRCVMDRRADGSFTPFCFVLKQRIERLLPVA